mmetsp:Transcript_24379/g.46262  ORF Transcript_24379/g.46262 Transcript_24379/m.46262 type:complete len:135 (-) Transcript_24379:1014-1418(-)
MFYGTSVFDPILIIAQIVSMQCLHYLSLGLLQWLLLGPYVPHFSLYYFFDYHAVNVHKFSGWCDPCTVCAWDVNSQKHSPPLCLTSCSQVCCAQDSELPLQDMSHFSLSRGSCTWHWRKFSKFAGQHRRIHLLK